jgi:hypothetical protein
MGSIPKSEQRVSATPKNKITKPRKEIFILKLSSLHLPQRKNIEEIRTIVTNRRIFGELKA